MEACIRGTAGYSADDLKQPKYRQFIQDLPKKTKSKVKRPTKKVASSKKWYNSIVKARVAPVIGRNADKTLAVLNHTRKRWFFAFKKHLPKLVIGFLVSGALLGIIQSYNQTDNELHRTRIQATHELQDAQKTKEAIKHELDIKAAENAAKDVKIQELESQLQTTQNTISGRGGLAYGTGTSVEGNTYYWGQCVWHVKNQLSWVRNGWGNANQWIYSAQADGFATGSVPRVGAVAQTSMGYYGHVAIVRVVYEDTILVEEMNYEGLGIIDERVTPASDWQYIYP